MHPYEWKQKGNIFLWRYEGNPSNYCGWHLHCDDAGCDSLADLINSFTDTDESIKRTVLVSKPTYRELAVAGCNRKSLNTEKLVIAKSEQWAINSDDGKTFLCISEDDISRLVDGILGIKSGKGDYFIGNSGNEIWFWW